MANKESAMPSNDSRKRSKTVASPTLAKSDGQFFTDIAEC